MSLLEMSAGGGALVLAVAAVRALAGRRVPRRVFWGLWGLCGLRLLVPAALPSRLCIYALASGSRGGGAVVPPGRLEALAPVLPALEPAPPGGAAVSCWLVVYLAGALVLAGWFAGAYLRWSRRFRAAVPLETPEAALLGRQGRRVRLRVSDRISAPLTCGILRPVILLPQGTDWGDREALRFVLAHEGVHIRRLDGLYKLALTAAVCVHWFNPLAWALYVLAGRDMELSCDEAVVRLCGPESRGAYARALLRLEERRGPGAPLCSYFSQNGLEERIRSIMSIPKYSIPAILAVLLLTAAAAAVFATSPKPQPSAGATALEALEGSIAYEAGELSFTVPEEGWTILVTGRIAAEEDLGLSVHYLEKESAGNLWRAGETYRFAAQGSYEELWLHASRGGEARDIDLTAYLPQSAGEDAAPQTLLWPAEGCGRVAAAFGERVGPGGTAHDGVDIVGEAGGTQGASVLAAAGGTVCFAGWDSDRGNYVELDHGGGLQTVYAHCQRLDVETGDTVSQGTVLGTVGSTGRSTGAHLCFKLLQDGAAIDPLDYFASGWEMAQAE